ncbi:K+/H+ antiporter [Niveispirillum lacus]|uniref:K+/H+ antiporter n=1 Tax=Niveispirillum lacus TaxID=1981099 RepID=A0A255Z5T5_9PROT|nr:potassium/proton antiporter [Niveispirillum lacus]OYQ35980.1 K+/H+ antiporter [Niveispirillum lacus]
MEAINEMIFLAGLLLLLAILAGRISSRLGAPLLLVFLGLGMLAGEDGPGGIHFGDFKLAYLFGSTALAVILFDGGLRTHTDTFRLARWPALSLATAGVLITAVVTGALVCLVMGVGWKEGFLVGSIIASTDAAAVFFLLNLRGLALRGRVSATLEVESGLNDPMAVLLTLLAVTILISPAGVEPLHLLLELIQQMVGGVIFGVAAGYALVWLVNRLDLADGLYPILALSFSLFVFGGAQAAGASGFLAVYLAGLILGNRPHKADRLIRRFHDGLAWLAQIGLFVMLGLLVTPSLLGPYLLSGTLVALGLMLVARPLAVFASLLPFRFTLTELTYISWVGLRGAVPIVLAAIPVLAGVPNAQAYFAVAFVVVLLSLLIQGWTVGPSARLLGLLAPPQPEPPSRADVDLPDGSGQLAVFTVARDSEAAKRGRGKLIIPESVQLLALIQNGRPVRPEDAHRLQPGDTVLAMGDGSALAVMDRLFGRKVDTFDEDRPAGDFQIQGDMPAMAVGGMYGFDAGDDPTQTLSDLIRRRLGHDPSLGDRVRVGEMELIVVSLKAGEAEVVGIDLTPPATGWAGFRQQLQAYGTRIRRRLSKPRHRQEAGGD